jgi:hypothetical protein
MDTLELAKLRLGLSFMTEEERAMLWRYIEKSDCGRKVIEESSQPKEHVDTEKR